MAAVAEVVMLPARVVQDLTVDSMELVVAVAVRQ